MVFDNRKALSVSTLAPSAPATLRATVTFTSLPNPAGALFAEILRRIERLRPRPPPFSA